uniref:Putative secreted protein n=1 Tax=Anopheles marajoara TaxID=58244 RepID=A0A2M4CDX2_9DIPT
MLTKPFHSLCPFIFVFFRSLSAGGRRNLFNSIHRSGQKSERQRTAGFLAASSSAASRERLQIMRFASIDMK